MKRKLLHFTNHLGKPAAVRAEDVLYIQSENYEDEASKSSGFVPTITLYNGTKLWGGLDRTAEELIKALSEIIEQ